MGDAVGVAGTKALDVMKKAKGKALCIDGMKLHKL
jgi:hypothetical protein